MTRDMQDLKKGILAYLHQVFGYTWATANPKKIMFANKHDTKVLNDLAQELSTLFTTTRVKELREMIEEASKHAEPDPTNKMGEDFNGGYQVGYETAIAYLNSKIEELKK